ncbi:hypothetical protein Ddye_015013 [Dipteronia dyeriana]|uniref:Uncharacterized protein n=1 Tax=Dipteronia dyeriana TaxID=168575 RepID=A0AAD9U548_9ROSI|nr:hypothetical protein Ddye_015013 [Dipteronia dyeriana]
MHQLWTGAYNETIARNPYDELAVHNSSDEEDPHMKRKVLRLSESSNEIKGKNLMLTESTSKELFEDPLKSIDQSKRWKIKSFYRDISLAYRDNETIVYVASRMPVVY